MPLTPSKKWSRNSTSKLVSTIILARQRPELPNVGSELHFELVKDRDMRIGACADTGHWVRSGLNPVDCLKILSRPRRGQPFEGLARF